MCLEKLINKELYEIYKCNMYDTNFLSGKKYPLSIYFCQENNAIIYGPYKLEV